LGKAKDNEIPKIRGLPNKYLLQDGEMKIQGGENSKNKGLTQQIFPTSWVRPRTTKFPK
jgi:hypothetical protein